MTVDEQMLALMVEIDYLQASNKRYISMQPNTIKMDCYEVYTTNTGFTQHYAYVKNEELAQKLCGNNPFRKYEKYDREIKILGTVAEVEENLYATKIEYIKTKLTLEEQKILGLI